MEFQNSPSANFSIYNGEVIFDKSEFDEDFVENYRSQIKHAKFNVNWKCNKSDSN